MNDEIPISDITGGGVVFEPSQNANGDPYATFEFQVSDGIEYSASSYTMSINVEAVNDAPQVSGPTDVTLLEDISVPVTGISISDVDVNEGTGKVQVTLSVEHGTLTFAQTSGLFFDAGSNGSSDITVSGAIDDVNAALATLVYSPSLDYSGTDSVQIVVDDLGNYGEGGPRIDELAIPITINSYASDVREYGLLDTSGASEPFESTNGPMIAVNNLLSMLETERLFPASLAVGEDIRHDTSAVETAQFHSLIFQLLFGENEDARNVAADDLFAFLEEGVKKHRDSDQWLGLRDFMARLHEWRGGMTFDDIVLAFNAEECNLCDSLLEFVDPGHRENGIADEQIPGLKGSSEHYPEGMTLVFNLDEMRVADMFLGETEDYCLTGLSSMTQQPDHGTVEVFNLNELSLVDTLAS